MNWALRALILTMCMGTKPDYREPASQAVALEWGALRIRAWLQEPANQIVTLE